MERLNSPTTNERAERAPAAATLAKRLIVGGIFVFALAVLTGCITILPQWRPTREIGRQFSSQPITGTTPIIVQSGNERFILFIGFDESGGDNDLYLQRMNAAGELVGSPVRLTINTGADDQPRMVEQGGWLYIVWRYLHTPSSSYGVWWVRVNTATLYHAAGPTEVSSGVPGDNVSPDLAVRPDGTSVVVWANRNPTSTIYYRQVISNGTLASTPVIVSQGPGCAPAQFAQVLPRVTRSLFGRYAQIAWIGGSSAVDSSVYWREFDNNDRGGAGAPSSDCFRLSDGVDYAGVTSGPRQFDLAINPLNGDSYVAWSHYGLASGFSSYNVYFRRVQFSPRQVCKLLNLSNAITTAHDLNVRIAAGHAVSNWVHLVWERFQSASAEQSAIHYALVEDTDCSASPRRITTNDVVLSRSPVPAYANVESPRIAVAQNAPIVLIRNTSGSLLVMGAAAAGHSLTTTTTPEAGSPPSEVFEERPMPSVGVEGAAAAQEAENIGQPMPMPNCAAESDHPRCVEIAMMETLQMSALSAQASSAASSFRCGTNAADAVLVSFFDDTNDRIYAALFQVGEVRNGNSCGVVVSAEYPSLGGLRLQPLLRDDYSAPNFVDHDDHFPFISARGLPTVAWRGRKPGTIVVSLVYEGIYVAEAKFPAYVPIVRRP
ncbi:MAG: hypothetical protein RMJ86_06115 [Anaerolineae bacterium]|nr:hypothetical protein [Anaerolineae bacterium]